VFLIALPGTAFAHPGDPGATSGPTHQHPSSSDSGGGANTLLIVGVVIGVIATAGALYAAKGLQNRPQPAAEPAEPPAEPKPAAPHASELPTV
jgi:hypothetical protein